MATPQVFDVLWDVLVDLVRFELTTSSMPWKRAPNCATGPSCSRLSFTLSYSGTHSELTHRLTGCLQ